MSDPTAEISNVSEQEKVEKDKEERKVDVDVVDMIDLTQKKEEIAPAQNNDGGLTNDLLRGIVKDAAQFEAESPS